MWDYTTLNIFLIDWWHVRCRNPAIQVFSFAGRRQPVVKAFLKASE